MLHLSHDRVGISVGSLRFRGPTWNVSESQRRQNVRSEKLQNESFPNFSNFRPEFCPEFCSEFSPNFSRTFRASVRGRRRPDKNSQKKSPPFFNTKFPGRHEKNIHKILLESRQSNKMTIKTIFERSSQKGGRQRVRKEGQQETHLEI